MSKSLNEVGHPRCPELVDRRLAGNLVVLFSFAAQSSDTHVLDYSHPVEQDIVPGKPSLEELHNNISLPISLDCSQ